MHPPARPTTRRAATALSASLLALAIPWGAVAQDESEPPPTGSETDTTAEATEGPAAEAATTVPGRLKQAKHPKGGPGLRVFDIVEGGPGYIAVGGGTPTGLDHQALVWLSDDGVRWQTQPLFGEAALGTMRGVAALPDGGFVAVGHDFEPQTERDELVHAIVWYSADGFGWQRVPADASFPNSMMWDVTSTPDGVAVAGCEAQFHCTVGRVWTSADGFNWELTDDIPMAPYDIAANATGDLVISGEDDGVDLVNGRASAAASAEDWTVRSFATPDSQVRGAASFGEGFLLASTLNDVNDGRTIGSGLEVSMDGIDWDIMQPDALSKILLLDVDTAGDLVALVGQDRSRKNRWPPFIAWTRDLETFAPVALPRKLKVNAFGGEDVRLTDDGSRLFVFGQRAGRPAIWTTTFESES
jgi:hypothetical protein